MTKDKRPKNQIKTSVDSLMEFLNINTIKIDTTNRNVNEVVSDMINMIEK